MNKLLKWFLAVSGTIAGLFVLLALVIYFFIDLNHFKKDIEERVNAETGLELNITGDLRLSLLKGFNFTTQDIVISSQQKTLADIGRIELGMKLSSLFYKQPIIDSLALEVRELIIKRDKQGHYNFFPETIKASKAKQETASDLPVKDFSIENIHLNINKLVVEDEAASLVLNFNQIEAALSLLPIIEHQELVFDVPRIITNYMYEGSLKVNTLDINRGTLNHYQLSDLDIKFKDRQGKLTAQQMSFKLLQLSADNTRVKSQKGAPLVMDVSAKMTATIAYPVSEEGHEAQWIKPESILINQLDLQLKDLTLNHPSGRLTTRDLKAELNNIPLHTAGKWVAADLLIEHAKLVSRDVEFNTTENIRYLMRPSTIEADYIPVFKNGRLADFLSAQILRSFAQKGTIKLNSKGIDYQQQAFTDINLQLLGKKGRIELLPFKFNFSGVPINGKGSINLSGRTPEWTVQVQGRQVKLEAVRLLFGMQDTDIIGRVDVDNTFSGRGLGAELRLVNGKVDVSGHDIQVDGFDLDAIIDNFTSSQSVGLMDIGAYALLGPAGMLINKGNDYLQLTHSVDVKGSTHIPQLRTRINIKQSIARVEDVCFATAKHRLAFKGEVDLIQRAFKNFQVATVDEKGCAIYEESITGTLDAPRAQKVNLLVKGVINPVTSVLSRVTDPIIGRCQTPFYSGSVASP